MVSRNTRHTWTVTAVAVSLVALFALVMLVGVQTAYVGAQATTETPTPPHSDGNGVEHSEDSLELTEEEQALIEAGRQVYVGQGCAACHGENAEGTDFGNALPGHTEAAIRRQVRAPTGAMPAYSSETLSASDLDALVTYIDSLEGEHGHDDTLLYETSASIITQHLWMTLYVLSDEDPEGLDDALHHIRHIIELAEEPQLAEVQEIELLLLDGNLHDAEHAIEEMLADNADLDISPELVHLQSGLAAVRIEDVKDAIHHLEHFVELATEDEREQGEDVLILLGIGDLEEAEHSLEAMIDAAVDHAGEEDEPVDEDDHEE